MSEDLGMCMEKVWNGWSHSACTKRAKVVRGSRHLCGIHDRDSPAKKARREERARNWEAQRATWAEERKRREAIARLCGHIATDELDNYTLVRKGGAA